MILSGTALATKLETELAQRIVASGKKPKLVVVLIGNDPASKMYDARKAAAAARVGIDFELHAEETATTESLITLVQNLNVRADVDGILIQLPLPAGIDTDAVIAAMDPAKDVDGFHPKNIADFIADVPGARTPVLLEAIEFLLVETTQNFSGKNALIIGKSDVFLAPLTHLLEKKRLQTTFVKPEDITPELTGAADVLVVAVGHANLITAAHIKPGATVIDIGINRLPTGRVVGDVNFEEVEPLANWITPTPGGVGPVTIACAMRATAACSDAR